MTILVTGAAGFIGYHVAETLLGRGEKVVGIDNLNAYYDVALKEARLERLRRHRGFRFEKLDIADRDALGALFRERGPFRQVVHLAAQAGVRHSLDHPFDYVSANLVGHLAVLEECRRQQDGLDRLVYASSSSVYGGNAKLPFSVEDRTDAPVSLYAATKRADELMSHAYAHLFRIPQVGLRFFTVYGPWGRPDMAIFKFVRAILAGEPIEVFNEGRMKRDFTYVEDIVAGVLAAMERPDLTPTGAGAEPPHRIYNLGNHRSEDLLEMIAIIEDALDRKAIRKLAAMQPGDVAETYADIAASRRDLGFSPTTSIREGIPKFVAWYRDFYRV